MSDEPATHGLNPMRRAQPMSLSVHKAITPDSSVLRSATGPREEQQLAANSLRKKRANTPGRLFRKKQSYDQRVISPPTLSSRLSSCRFAPDMSEALRNIGGHRA